MMAEPTDDNTPPIIIHPDGSVEVLPEMAHHIMALAAHNVYPYLDEVHTSTITTVLAVAAGYSVGIGSVTRDDILTAQETIMGAFEAGMAAGMEQNPNLPKLNG